MLNNKLTIIIPTYNRCQSLKVTLANLCKNNYDQIKIIVLDNNSKDSTEFITREFQETYGFLEYKKNSTNIGLNANLLRTIEICETDWLWMLSDDDFIIDDCFHVIDRNLDNSENLLLINFATREFVHREKRKVTLGLESFLMYLDSFPNALFISTNLVNAKKLKKNISLGYQYTYSMIPYFIMLLDNLKKESSLVVFSQESIVKFNIPERIEKWSYLNLYLGLPTLLEAIPDLNEIEKELIKNKIFSEVQLSISTIYSIYELYSNNKSTANNISSQIFFRNKSITILPKYKLFLLFLIVKYAFFRNICFLFCRISIKNDINKLNSRII